ncbi:MAG: hypothetical protein LRS49_05910 [Desulfurococcales archaeon]|nr:hypothetical protein [Desulfurococcales archaeon]
MGGGMSSRGFYPLIALHVIIHSKKKSKKKKRKKSSESSESESKVTTVLQSIVEYASFSRFRFGALGGPNVEETLYVGLSTSFYDIGKFLFASLGGSGDLRGENFVRVMERLRGDPVSLVPSGTSFGLVVGGAWHEIDQPGLMKTAHYSTLKNLPTVVAGTPMHASAIDSTDMVHVRVIRGDGDDVDAESNRIARMLGFYITALLSGPARLPVELRAAAAQDILSAVALGLLDAGAAAGLLAALVAEMTTYVTLRSALYTGRSVGSEFARLIAFQAFKEARDALSKAISQHGVSPEELDCGLARAIRASLGGFAQLKDALGQVFGAAAGLGGQGERREAIDRIREGVAGVSQVLVDTEARALSGLLHCLGSRQVEAEELREKLARSEPLVGRMPLLLNAVSKVEGKLNGDGCHVLLLTLTGQTGGLTANLIANLLGANKLLVGSSFYTLLNLRYLQDTTCENTRQNQSSSGSRVDCRVLPISGVDVAYNYLAGLAAPCLPDVSPDVSKGPCKCCAVLAGAAQTVYPLLAGLRDYSRSTSGASGQPGGKGCPGEVNVLDGIVGAP